MERKSVWRRELGLPSPEHGVALLFVGAIVAFVFRDFLFGGRVFYEGDVQTFWYAQVRAFVAAVTAGAWPVWDPRSSFGEPLWAYPTQVPYPTTWLYLLFAPWRVYTTIVALHLVFSGLGVYALARRLEVSRVGALAGAAAWILCGPFVSVVNMVNNVIGVAWLPWIVLAAHNALDSGGAFRACLWGASLAAPVLAGSEAVFMGGLLTAADTLRRISWRRPADAGNARLVRSAAIALLFALALSAAQWVPTLELTRRTSRRALSREVRTDSSLDVMSLAQVAIPIELKGLPFRDWGTGSPWDLQTFLGSVHLGAPLIALAAAAFDSRHRRRAWFLGAAALASVGFALGRHAPIYDPLVFLFPPLQAVRFPVKGMILAAFCASVLAAMGVDGWRETAPKGSRWTRWVVAPSALLAVLALVAAAALNLAAESLGRRFLVGGAALSSFDEILRRAGERLTLGAGVGVLVLVLALWRRRRPAALGLASVMALVMVLELVTAHSSLIRSAPKELYRYCPPFVSAIGPGEHSRLFSATLDTTTGWRRPPPGMSTDLAFALTARDYLMPPVAAVCGFSGSYEKDYKNIQPPFLAEMAQLAHAAKGTRAQLRLLQLGAVTHVVSLDPGELEGVSPISAHPSPFGDLVYFFRVTNPVPRTFVAGRAVVADGRAALEALLDPAFDAGRDVVLASGVRGAPPGGGSPGSSRIIAFRADRVEIEAELEGAGYVVLVDGFDPWWRATVDDRETPVLRANVAFRAVAAGPGQHRIIFAYRPHPVFAGLVVAGLGLAGGLGLAVRECLKA